MQAGNLRHSVAIQNGAETTDSKGGFTVAWSTVETVWADIRPISSKDEFSAGQVGSEVTHRVVLRYTANATHKRRILWGSRKFNIVSIRNWNERNEFLLLQCKEDRT